MIKFTKQMLSAPLDEVIFNIDWKLYKGLKQSQWRRYRIVAVVRGRNCAANTSYRVEETYIESYFSLRPRFLGGSGFMYDVMYWRISDLDEHMFKTHHEAVQKVDSMIRWVKDIESRVHEVKTESIISWHPEG